MRKLNVVFLLGLVVALLALSGAVYLVHGHQVQRNASVLLDRARKDDEQGKGPKAAEALRQYLNLKPRDGDAWRSYARVLDKVITDRRSREQVFLVYEEALRYNPGDPELERRCVELALETWPVRTADARRHLEALLARAAQQLDKNDEVADAAIKLAELKELEGNCSLLEAQLAAGATAEANYEAAANAFLEAISYDPTRLLCFFQRARLERNQLHKDPKDADAEIAWMVANNPESGLAYYYRSLYRSEFRLPDAESDLKKALQLAPENAEVLSTAAQFAEQKKDPAAARAFLEKGLRLHPQNEGFPLALARLELQEQHLDQAEVVLRKAYQAKPSGELAIPLAETLIQEGKVEGEDGARILVSYLEDRGARETWGRYLEARIEMQAKHWNEAIPKIESALAFVKNNPRLTTQLNQMLAQCYAALGLEEKSLVALSNASEGVYASATARLAQARTLAASGKVDEALAIVVPMAEGNPKLRLDVARLWFQKTIRQPADQRNWAAVEKWLSEAEKASPENKEGTTLFRVEMLIKKEQTAQARSLLEKAQSTAPRNLNYRVALARLSDLEKKGAQSLQILDQAEKDLGPSLAITLARLDHWVQQGGAEGKAAVAKLAETRRQLPAADQPLLLDQLAVAEIRLGERDLARQYLRELSSLPPENLRVVAELFDLALAANDAAEARQLMEKLRKADGEQGTTGRLARALYLLDEAQRGDHKVPEEARTLASEIAARRADWWGAPLLNARIADLENEPEQALKSYLEAVRLGNSQPAVIRRLGALLFERKQFDEIDRLAQMLRDRNVALADLTILEAVGALRKGDYTRGIALVRQVFSDNSTSASDQLSLGRFYASARRTDEAEKRFKRATELAPGLPEAWLSYLQHLIQTKQPAQAKAAVEAARHALPADPYTLATCFIMVGDTAQAEAAIQTALKQKPADSRTLRLAASFYFERGRTEEAGKYLDALVAPITGPTADVLAWVNRMRAMLLLRTGRLQDVDQALKLVEHNLSSEPGSVDDRLLKASILAVRPSRIEEAIQIFESLSGADKLSAGDRFKLALLYLRSGHAAKYREQMLRLLEGKEPAPLHLVHYTNYLISHKQTELADRRKQLEEADRWLGVLRKLEPKSQGVLELQAALFNARGQQSDLLALLQTRGREVPDQIGPVADLLNRYGFPKEAEAAYKMFIARDPKQPARVLALAQFLASKDRVGEAMNILRQAWSTCRPDQVAIAALPLYDAPSAGEAEKRQIEAWVAEAVQKRPDVTVLASKLGVIWIYQRRFDDAEALFRRLLDSNPDMTDVLNNLAWILALRDQDKAQDALRLIDHAVEVGGQVPSLLGTQAVVLIRAGQADRALSILERARIDDPTKPSLTLHQAWAYQVQGKTDEARTAFQKAKDLGWKLASSDPLEHPFLERLEQELTLPGGKQ